MLQDIHPHSFTNHFKAGIEPVLTDFAFVFDNNHLLLKKSDEGYQFPTFGTLNIDIKQTGYKYLFDLNGQNCFLVSGFTANPELPFSFHELYFFRSIAQKEIAWLATLAFQLNTWYEQHAFCGKCGAATEPKSNERAIICNPCGLTVYPKISPAVIVAIIDGNNILLAKGANYRFRNFTLIAGYADVGETLEETVKREVKEEVGIDVFNIRYFSSQPWPFSSSMMIGFTAEADANQPLNIDLNEIEEAAWFSRDALPEHPSGISIAGAIIEKFKNNQI